MIYYRHISKGDKAMFRKECTHCVEKEICLGMATCPKCGHIWCNMKSIECPNCGDDGEYHDEDEG